MSDPIVSERLEATKVSRLDVWIFMGAFGAGLAIYGLLRLLGVWHVVITLSMVAVMIAYAVVVALVPRLRVRLDQAGDNAYYLGLLFTLSSMAVALYEFGVTELGSGPERGAAGARQIIGNFGIALGTTITGIFLRVVLHQMRIDPADVENMTRIELSEAAKRVKATLDSVAGDMGRLLDEMRQRTSDQLAHLVEEVGGTLADFTSRVVTATKELTDGTSVAHAEAATRMAIVSDKLLQVASEAERAVRSLRQIEPPPLRLVAGLDEVSSALHKVAGDAERAGERFMDSAEVSGKASQALVGAAAKLIEASDVAGRTLSDTLTKVEEAATRVGEGLTAVGQGLETDRKQLAALEEQSKRSAQAAQESQEAASQVLRNLVDMTRGLTDFFKARDGAGRA